MTEENEIPKFRCHKVVQAFKIREVEQHSVGPTSLIPELGFLEPREVSLEYETKHCPEAGGYFVLYEDGYESYSPGGPFEDGYAEITAGPEVLDDADNPEPLMKWFAWRHLPEHLQLTSQRFHDLARNVICDTDPGRERDMTLRKLLEAKDAAVRAKVHPGG